MGKKRRRDEAKCGSYQERIYRGLAQLQPVPGIYHVDVRHDDDCAIWRGGDCTCNPEIEMPQLPSSN